jgi:hypothetical protein
MPLPNFGNLVMPSGPHAPSAVPTANAPTISIGGGLPLAGTTPALGTLTGTISAPYTTAQNQFLSGVGPGALNPANNPFQQMGNIQPPTGMSPPPPTTGAGFAPFTPPNAQITQALRGIPPGVLQQLHSSGLIHPQLMSHVFRV